MYVGMPGCDRLSLGTGALTEDATGDVPTVPVPVPVPAPLMLNLFDDGLEADDGGMDEEVVAGNRWDDDRDDEPALSDG